MIQSKIRVYKWKWKSKLYIKQKLFERQENKDLIEKYLEEAFVDWELEIVKQEYEKLLYKFSIDSENMSFENKSKIIKKLLTKWFRYDDIKNLVI